MADSLILSVDPGYADCGWAVTSFRGQGRILVDAGEWNSTPEDGDDVQRVSIILACFERKLLEVNPDGVGVEAFTFQRGTHNSRVAAGMTRLIDRMGQMCSFMSVPFEEVPTSVAKAALGLKGKVSKARVRTAVEAYFGTRIAEHSADAVAVGVATRSRLLARGRLR